MKAKASLTAGIRQICRVMGADRGDGTGCEMLESRVWVLKSRVFAVFGKVSSFGGGMFGHSVLTLQRVVKAKRCRDMTRFVILLSLSKMSKLTTFESA